jgi:hypothetical protein
MVDIGVVVLSHVTTFCYWSHEEGTVDIWGVRNKTDQFQRHHIVRPSGEPRELTHDTWHMT